MSVLLFSLTYDIGPVIWLFKIQYWCLWLVANRIADNIYISDLCEMYLIRHGESNLFLVNAYEKFKY